MQSSVMTGERLAHHGMILLEATKIVEARAVASALDPRRLTLATVSDGRSRDRGLHGTGQIGGRCWRGGRCMTHARVPDIVEHPSPWPFDRSVERLVQEIANHDLTIFASVDDRTDTGDRGTKMPSATVLIVGRASDGPTEKFTEPGDALSWFADGKVMQVLACITRPVRALWRARPMPAGLAPLQLRRGKQVLLSDLWKLPSLQQVTQACELSVRHFSRAFKTAAGGTPQRWLLAAPVAKAKQLLSNPPTPLVDVAGIRGFADQNQVCRVLVRFAGSSRDAWHRPIEFDDPMTLSNEARVEGMAR